MPAAHLMLMRGAQNQEAAQPMAAAAITPVASEPSHNTGPDTVKRPITLALTAISMSSVITGTATMPLAMPLMTAIQTNARIGLIVSTFAIAPITMAARIVCVEGLGLRWLARDANRPPARFL
jgi:hypothetical protein